MIFSEQHILLTFQAVWSYLEAEWLPFSADPKTYNDSFPHRLVGTIMRNTCGSCPDITMSHSI